MALVASEESLKTPPEETPEAKNLQGQSNPTFLFSESHELKFHFPIFVYI